MNASSAKGGPRKIPMFDGYRGKQQRMRKMLKYLIPSLFVFGSKASNLGGTVNWKTGMVRNMKLS